MKHIFIVAATLWAMGALGQDALPDGWPKDTERVVVRAYYDDLAHLNEIRERRATWKVERRKQFFVIDADRAEYDELVAMGYRVEVHVSRTAELNAPRIVSPAQRAGIPGFSCYRTVTETLATGAQLAADYPDLATWSDIGDSWDKQNGFGGEELMVLKITNSAIGGDKPKLFVMSAIHAREYTTAELNTRFAEYLLNNYGTDADATWMVDFHEIHLLLQANPDGRRQAQTGLSWRKNTNQNYCGATSNLRGADLNRNFEFEWGCCNGSSGSTCSEVYRGPAAGSEPESAAVMDYVRSIFPDNRGPGLNAVAPADTQGVFIDVHSFSELVIWPWGSYFQSAPNAAGLQTLGRRLAWFNGYDPSQATTLGITDGTTDDFAYGELGVAAYTFELGTTFFQSCGAFEGQIFPDNLQSLIYAARVVRAPYLLPSGPDVVGVTFSSAAVAPGDSVALTATADDTRFENQSGTEPTQAIVAARYTVDTPPWEAGASPQPLAAADGSFNATSESIEASIDTTGLAGGRHTVYVEAQDASGAWGPVSAAFLYIIDPASAPRISGRILAADTGAPLAATVSAGNFSTTSDPATGDYELLLVPGTYDLTVTPSDGAYGARSISALTLADFDVETQNVLLYPFCAVFGDDMETTDVAWTTTGAWARTQSQANSPVTSWTDSPSGNYGNNSNTSLTSPAIDLAGVADATLEFASRCNTEATYDFCIVEVSTDGSNWTEIARYDGSSSSFVARTLDASALAGSASARFRFRLETDVSITRDGWYVDDVALRAAGPLCVTATDTDGDGVDDLVDSCTLIANPGQVDTNGDGYGNACDPDLDGNGIVNAVDLGLFKAAFFAPGVTDSDFNADGITNVLDLGILKAFFFAAPGPSALGD